MAADREDLTRTDLGFDVGHKPTPGQAGAIETHVPDIAASVGGSGKNALMPRREGILHQQQSRHGLAAILIPVDLEHPAEGDSLLIASSEVGHQMHGSRRLQAQVPQAGCPAKRNHWASIVQLVGPTSSSSSLPAPLYPPTRDASS